MSFVPSGGTFNIVRRVTVDEETLEKIADLLGIQRGQVISGTIFISAPPSPPSGGAPPSAPSGGAPPSAPSGGAPPSPPSGGAPPSPPSGPRR